ncbi:MAG: DMT family transporter [Cellvibrionaceae bacterium]
MNSVFFLTTVFIWGTTWIAIHWQLGSVEPLISIFYRFAIAAVLFLPVLLLLGKLQNTRIRDHLFFVLQGLCLFSLNYICFYTASQYIISGLIAVIFASAILFNALNQWLIWQRKPSLFIYIAGVLGISGLVILFWEQLLSAHESHNIIYGIIYSIVGTYLFSLGNMVSLRNSTQHIQPWTSNAYGMIYGTLILLFIIWLLDIPWGWDERPLYWGSLLYLSIPGSILGFTIYLALVARIGANQAAYTTVLFPVVALTISTFLEGYIWGYKEGVGLTLVIIGVLFAIKGDYLLKIVLSLITNKKSVAD